MAVDHPGKIVFSTTNPPAVGPKRGIRVLAGDGSATVSSGYGGWETINRPGREAVVNWTGFEPLRVTIPILFNSLESGLDEPGVFLEGQISQLEGMAGRGLRRQSGEEPPVVYVDAPGSLVPHHMQGNSQGPTEYVIESIDWGDALRNSVGNRIRQAADVTLMRHVTARGLERSAAKRRKAGKQGLPKTYIVKKGDTLSKLAKRFYNDPDEWKTIYHANKQKVRDPKKLKVGTKLRIPALKKKK